jgi:hypothetical protein
MKTERFFAAVVSFALFVASADAQTPSFQWSKRVASTDNSEDELSTGLAIDSAGNVYVTGWFDGENDFGGIVLTNTTTGGQDIFVAKYDSTGALVWVQQAGSDTPSWNGGRGIGVDTNGNVYVTGQFFGNASFGTNIVSALTNQEFFLAKYDSSGTVQWVRQSTGGNGTSCLGWSDGVYGTGLAVDGAGNSYGVGFAANVTTCGTMIKFGTNSLLNTNVDGASTFLVKYDNGGNVKWLQLLSSSNEVYATKVAVESVNVYVRGGFQQNLRIGTSNLTATSSEDCFVAKFSDPNAGLLMWVQRTTGAQSAEGGVAVDQSDNVYISGPFVGGSMNFDGIVLTNAGSFDAFLAKYNSLGAIQWAKRAGGTNLDFYWDVTLDQQGNPNVGGALGYSATPPSGSGGVVAGKYDSSGNLQWVKPANGAPATPVGSIATKCAVDSLGNLYLAGWYQTATSFDTNVLQPQAYWNFFLTKVGFIRPTLGINQSNTVIRVSVSGGVSNRFVLEHVSALPASNNWQSMATSTIVSSPIILMDTNTSGSSNRFYRARLVP